MRQAEKRELTERRHKILKIKKLKLCNFYKNKQNHSIGIES